MSPERWSAEASMVKIVLISSSHPTSTSRQEHGSSAQCHAKTGKRWKTTSAITNESIVSPTLEATSAPVLFWDTLAVRGHFPPSIYIFTVARKDDIYIIKFNYVDVILSCHSKYIYGRWKMAPYGQRVPKKDWGTCRLQCRTNYRLIRYCRSCFPALSSLRVTLRRAAMLLARSRSGMRRTDQNNFHHRSLGRPTFRRHFAGSQASDSTVHRSSVIRATWPAHLHFLRLCGWTHAATPAVFIASSAKGVARCTHSTHDSSSTLPLSIVTFRRPGWQIRRNMRLCAD